MTKIKREIVFFDNFTLDCEELIFGFNNSEASNQDVLKYFKMKYKNYDSFFSKYLNPVLKDFYLEKEFKDLFDGVKKFAKTLVADFDKASPFTYLEAFELKADAFKPVVFGVINVSDMIKEMGHERYKTEGITLTQKKYDSHGNLLGESEQSNVYEVHKVNGEKLGLTEDIYAVKCWCTSTSNEHWLWIEAQYKDDPLEAIASTFRVHKSIIPHIKALKRQGDVLLCEMSEDVTPDKNDEIVPLTKDQYFSLLEAQA